MRIFYDIDTQTDFMNENGALYVPKAEEIKPNLKRLTNFAKKNRTPVFGSVDKHFGTQEYAPRETELQKYGGPFPDHCMDKTKGQMKIQETILAYADERQTEFEFYQDGLTKALYIEHPIYYGYPETPIPEYFERFWKEEKLPNQKIKKLWNEVRQELNEDRIELSLQQVQGIKQKQIPQGIYFEKQSYDVFTNPHTEVVLQKAGITEAVVYGVATDYCVKTAVLGMQQRGIQTYVVTDAIKGVAPETTQSALEEMISAGAKLVKTKDVIGGRI